MDVKKSEQDITFRPYMRGPRRRVKSTRWDVDLQLSINVLKCGHTVTRKRYMPQHCYCEVCGK